LRRLIGNEPALSERIDVHAIPALGQRLYGQLCGPPTVAPSRIVRKALDDAARSVKGHSFTPRFLWSEWEQVVDAWQLTTWESYRDVPRLGRKTRLPQAQREILWELFELVRSRLRNLKLVTHAEMFTALASTIEASGRAPY